MSAAPFCYVCRRSDRELRPYGKRGKPICFPCMEGDPQRQREARKRLARRLLSAAGSVPVIGGMDGPVPIESLPPEEQVSVVLIDPRTGVALRRGKA